MTVNINIAIVIIVFAIVIIVTIIVINLIDEMLTESENVHKECVSSTIQISVMNTYSGDANHHFE